MSTEICPCPQGTQRNGDTWNQSVPTRVRSESEKGRVGAAGESQAGSPEERHLGLRGKHGPASARGRMPGKGQPCPAPRQSDSGSKPGAASDQPCAGVVTGPLTWRPRAPACQPQKSYLQACDHTQEWVSRLLPPPPLQQVPRAGGAGAAGVGRGRGWSTRPEKRECWGHGEQRDEWMNE